MPQLFKTRYINFMKKIACLAIITTTFSCSPTKEAAKPILKNDRTFELTTVSKKRSYGYTEKNPIQVGGVDKKEGPLNERRYLNALAGPEGEKVFYKRVGSCCPIKSKNDPLGFGMVMLDVYKVTWQGSFDTVQLYINMYDYGPLQAPLGFTIKP